MPQETTPLITEKSMEVFVLGAAQLPSPQPQPRLQPALASLIPDKKDGRTWSQRAESAQIKAKKSVYILLQHHWKHLGPEGGECSGESSSRSQLPQGHWVVLAHTVCLPTNKIQSLSGGSDPVDNAFHFWDSKHGRMECGANLPPELLG